jgi:YggT family protein
MSSIASFINLVIFALSVAIIGRALFSWFDPGMKTMVGRLLRDVTEPIIAPIRQVMPRMGMLDLSPIVALVLLQLISRLVNQALVS